MTSRNAFVAIFISSLMFQGGSCVPPQQSRTVTYDLLPSTTGSASELVRVTNDPLPEFWPRPSPDGKSILLHTRDNTKVVPFQFSIVRIDLGSPGRNLVTDFGADCPAWLPDGQGFVYCMYKQSNTESRLVRTSFGGARSGVTFVSNAMLGGWDSQPDVSPDGKRIAFHTSMAQKVMIATVEMNGSNFTIYCEGTSPRWSPDGKKIAFDRVVGKTVQCFLIDLAGGGQITQLTTTGYNTFPCWSPDGRWIAFLSYRDGFTHLFYMASDGSNVTQLTRGATNEVHPSWSADGYIYFSSTAGNSDDIWRLKPSIGR
jgi:TolB protein